MLWLIKLLEQCQLLQSATGVFCKVLQAVKVRQFSAIDTARCYLQIVCEQGAAFESTPEAQNLSIIIRRIVYSVVYIFISQSTITCQGGHIEDAWRVYIRNSTFYLHKSKLCRLV